MGLDSVELVMAWEESFGIEIDNSVAQDLTTPRRAIDWFYSQLRSDVPEDNGCLSMRAFFRVRRVFEDQGVPRRLILPQSRLVSFLDRNRRRDLLSAILEKAGFSPLARHLFGLQYTSERVADVISAAVINDHKKLRLEGHGWSRRQVREVLRAIVVCQIGVEECPDDAEFVRDLGVD